MAWGDLFQMPSLGGLNLDEMKGKFDQAAAAFNEIAEAVGRIEQQNKRILEILERKEIENVGSDGDGGDTLPRIGEPGNSTGVAAIDALLGRARDIGYPVD